MGATDTSPERDGGHVADQQVSDAEDRDTLADDREAVLEAREVRADAREASHFSRQEKTRGILENAAERDDEADARDALAQERDKLASLHSFLHDEEFEASLVARRSAANDRIHSKTDRASAAEDRNNLTESNPAESADSD